MNELIKRLSERKQPVEANRPEKSAQALKERIELGYVHILFSETGTELGIKLNKAKCDLTAADFENGKGSIHLEGAITLNYEKVKCIAEIHLENMEGEGLLVPIDETEYAGIMN